MKKEETLGTCGCNLLIFVFNLLLGGWSVNYLLLFVGEFSIPVAVAVAIHRWFGVL